MGASKTDCSEPKSECEVKWRQENVENPFKKLKGKTGN
jgi:hypothetical protein